MELDVLRAALRSAGTGVWEWHIDSDRLFEADLGLEQLGYAPGDIEPTQAAWDRLIHPEDLAANDEAFQRYLRGDTPTYQHRYRVLARDGSWHWFEERGQVVEWFPDGRPRRMLGTQTDLTPQLALEDAARMVAQAQRDRAVAEAANRAKTEFLSRVSHELRTPLNAVLGFAQLLEADPRDPPSQGQRARLALILESGRHLLQMIGDLLDLTRAESGALALRPQAVDALVLARECAAMLQMAAQDAGVTVRVDGGSAPPAWADPTRLRQVLLNLLGNAVKYNRRGGTVHVSAAVDGTMLRVTVEDTGLGIPGDELPRLFEPFFRGQRLAADGAGIGLPVARSLVQAMGGRIDVRSTPDVGSAFSFTLPPLP